MDAVRRFKYLCNSVTFGPLEVPSIEKFIFYHREKDTVIIRSTVQLGTVELTDYVCNKEKSRGWLVGLNFPKREDGEYIWEFSLP